MEKLKKAPNTFLMTEAEIDFLVLWGEWRADNSRDRTYYFNLDVYRMDNEAPFMIRCSDLAKLPEHVKTEVRAGLERRLAEINATSPQTGVTPKDLAVAHAIAFGRWLAANKWEGQGADRWRRETFVGFTEKTTADLYIDFEKKDVSTGFKMILFDYGLETKKS